MNLGQEPEVSVTRLYERCGITAGKGKKVLKRMMEKGWIIPHKFSRGGGSGGMVTLYEVTDLGWKILEKLGVSRPKRLTRGDWEHNLVARLIGMEGKKEGCEVHYEYKVEDRYFDVVCIRRDGKSIFYEIGMSDPAHEVENLLKAVEIPGVVSGGNRIVLVVRDIKFRKRVERIVSLRDKSGVLEALWEVKVVGDYLIK